MAPKKTQSRRGGFSLVELMIAIGILGVGLAMISTMLPSGILSNAESNQFAKITGMLDNAMPTIRMSLSNNELSTYLFIKGYQQDKFVTTYGASDKVWTYPVYAWPSLLPTDNSNTPIRSGNIFTGDTGGLPLGSFAYPVASDPIVQNGSPGVGYISFNRAGPLLPVWFNNSDWSAVLVAAEQGFVPNNRDGWMLAACPLNNTSVPPTQSEMETANDYVFVIFPYRKILTTDVCHVNFRFLRVHLTGGYVDAVWDDATKLIALVDVDNSKIVSGLTNSPLVYMADPRLGVRQKLTQDVRFVNGKNVSVLSTGNPGDNGWWLGVYSTAADVSPAVGAYVFRDRLKS